MGTYLQPPEPASSKFFDLVDRLVHVEIEPISTSRRKTETEIDALFATYRAAIFTGLLDLFAQALEILPTIQIEHLPRMADFAVLGAAVYAARGVKKPGTGIHG